MLPREYGSDDDPEPAASDGGADDCPQADGDDDSLDADAAVPGDADDAAGIEAGPDAGDEELAALVHRIVYQDEAAFAAFYRGLSSRVYALALRITRDIGCAEEVVEDTFWQVWRQAPRFDPERGNAVAWVRRIARSRALDALRALGRDPLRLAVELDGDDDVYAVRSDDDDGPARRIGAAQSAAQLEHALAALDPLRRQLVSLAFLRGCSQAEIAEETGLPLGTVKSHIRRALALMKASIESSEAAQLSHQEPA